MKKSIESPPDFERLVLDCIDADFWKWILVGKLSTRSSRFPYVCTAQTSNVRQNVLSLFAHVAISKMKKHFKTFNNVCHMYPLCWWKSWNVVGIWTDFRDKSQKIKKNIWRTVCQFCEIFLKFPKPNWLFIIQSIISFVSLDPALARGLLSPKGPFRPPSQSPDYSRPRRARGTKPPGYALGCTSPAMALFAVPSVWARCPMIFRSA